MKEKFITKTLNFMQKYKSYNDLEIKKIKYGLEGLYSLVLKLSCCLLIAIILGTFKETLLFLVFYTFIRTFSYGIHAKNNVWCWFSTILIYNIIPFFIKTSNLILPKYICYIVLILSLLSMILWAPADTPKKPLIRKPQRNKCKILSILVVIIYTIILIISKSNVINNQIISALFIQSILINPITYKITNTQFNNYKYYKK